MSLGRIVLSLLLCATIAVAKEVKIRKAWVRTFPNASLGIIPDNLGRTLAVGHDSTSAVAILLNTHGRQIGKASIPIPRVTGVVADGSGRLFVTGNEYGSPNVYCVAYARSLSRLLWAEQKNLSNSYSPPHPYNVAQLGPIVADEEGRAYIFGEWRYGLFLTEFRGDNLGMESIWSSYGTTYGRWARAGVRAPSGELYFVAASVVLHYPWITIQKYSPATQELTIYGIDPPPPHGGGYSLPSAATCDADGNLIIAGWRMQTPFTEAGTTSFQKWIVN